MDYFELELPCELRDGSKTIELLKKLVFQVL